MEENKKSNKGLIIAIVCLMVLLVVLIGYVVSEKVLSNTVTKNNTTTTTKVVDKDTNSSEEIVDLNKIDMSKELTSNFKITEIGDEILTESKDFDLLDDKLELNLENNTLNIIFEKVDSSESNNVQTYKKTINDIKKIYYRYYNDNEVLVSLYILTENKVYYGVFNYYGKFEESGLKEVENNSYDGLYEAELYCGINIPTFLPLGHTSEGVYYNLYTGKKIDMNNYYYYEDDNNFVEVNRVYKFGGIKGKYKLGIYSEFSDTLYYIINDNNNIYGYNGSRYDDSSEFKLLTSKKVSKVYYNIEKNSINLELEDGSNYDKTLENVYIKDIKID